MATDIAVYLEAQSATPPALPSLAALITGTPRNAVLHGDCLDVLPRLPAGSADFVLTDPPYLARYCGRDGRRVPNDDNDAWLKPAFAEVHPWAHWHEPAAEPRRRAAGTRPRARAGALTGDGERAPASR